MRAAISIVLLLVTAARADEPKPTPTPTPTPTPMPKTAPGVPTPVPKPAPGVPSPVPKTAPGVTPAEPPKPAEPAKPADKPASTNPFEAYTGANEQGRQLFDEARALLREGNQAAACAKFAEAYKQEEATSTQLSVARCRENEGKHAEAWRMFQDTAVRARSAGFEDRAKIATEAAQALEERLATVVIRLAAPIAPGTVVTVNDRLVDTAPEVREFVDPGTVNITAKGPTGVTSTRSFRIFVNNTMKVDVPTLQERSGGRQPIWIAVSAIAVGGGAIALGAGSGAVRLVGGAAIAGGVALFILAPRQRTTVVPMMVANESIAGLGVGIGGRF